MTTFRDFLVWYNNLDVVPFVEAVEKFQQFYVDKGIDVFQVGYFGTRDRPAIVISDSQKTKRELRPLRRKQQRSLSNRQT